MMKRLSLLLLLATSCHHTTASDPIALIQIQDRNGLTETISNPDRLITYETTDFLSPQPYKKVLRIYKNNGKNHSRITTYHPNGSPYQYLEAEEMRAHGTYKEWFPNGQLKIEATVIGGTADVVPGSQEDWVFDSLSKVWDEQGHLLALIPYEKGMLEGVSLYYYPTGQVEKEVPFLKNQIEGVVSEFSPEGFLKAKSEYKKGVKEGESIAFFSNESLSRVEEYREGLLQSGRYYDREGNLLSEIQNGGGFQAVFEDQELTLIEYRVGKPEGRVQKFTPSKELHRSFSIKNGNKQGEEIEYYLSSQLDTPSKKPVPKLSITWNEHAIHGCVKTWYSNGQMQSQREYARNQRSGPSLAWYRNGNLMMIEEYEQDQLVNGKYYKINKAEPVSTLTDGNGLATLYDETGALLRKITYLKGKPVDPEK